MKRLSRMTRPLTVRPGLGPEGSECGGPRAVAVSGDTLTMCRGKHSDTTQEAAASAENQPHSEHPLICVENV